MNAAAVVDVEALVARRPDGACFVSELRAAARPAGAEVVDAAIERAQRDGAVVVVSRTSPDEHIGGDLRIVAAVRGRTERDAVDAAERSWSAWLRQALLAHRCV